MQATSLRIVGWREWVALPELGIRRLKAKVDTGARTSALHAFYVQRFHQDGRDLVRFRIHPRQRSDRQQLECVAAVADERAVTDSGGHTERRLVIHTPILMGQRKWDIEVTLTDRDSMQFRMLLGRSAMRDGVLVDPAQSYLCGLPRQAL
jgi:hypothetical protein